MLIQDGRWMVDQSKFIIKNELIPYSLQKEPHSIKNYQKFATNNPRCLWKSGRLSPNAPKC